MNTYLETAHEKVNRVFRMMKEARYDGDIEKPSFGAEIVKPILKRLVAQNGYKFIEENSCEEIEDDIRKYLIHDVAMGREAMNISVEKGNAEQVMQPFKYIKKSVPYDSACIQVSTTIKDDDCCKDCEGNCLTASKPCVCARHTRGEYAYTPDGLLTNFFLKECMKDDNVYEYCKSGCSGQPGECEGHRRFIKECWMNCGCTNQCGNRVVQRGITRKIQVFWINEHKGWGVRTLERLPAGAFICEYAGEVMTNNELDKRNESRSNDVHTYPVLLDADRATEQLLNDDQALCLDATNYGNVARFMNHRCKDGNMIGIPVQVETTERHYYHLAFFTTREVDASEELTWDYGIEFDDDNHPVKAFRCNCESAHCRGDKNKDPGPKLTRPGRKRRRGSASCSDKNSRQVKRGVDSKP